MNYDTIGNITLKVQTHLIVGTNTSQEPKETNYTFDYKYSATHPHAVIDAGDKLYTYDDDGNMLGWASKTTNAARVISWNEENRVKNMTDSGNGTDFVYDDTGERVTKRGGGNETVYVNRFYAVKNGDLGTKHIFVNQTRVTTKLEKDGGGLQTGVPGSIALINSQGIQNAITRGNGQQIGINRRLPSSSGGTTTTINPPIEKFGFFYHGDHLGSSNFITDDLGAVYQDLEYFPYGEQWVEDGGSGQMPMYRFTGQEFDPETGLYYVGARYYDPQLSRWISADPILAQYLPNLLDKKELDKNWQPERDLPGFGGVFHSINVNLFQYGGNNPVKYVDPSGKTLDITGTIEEIKRLSMTLEKTTGTKLKSSMEHIGGKGKNSQYKATITGFKSIDKRFYKEQEKLNAIVKSPTTVTVRFDVTGHDLTAWYKGGTFDPHTGVASLNMVYFKSDLQNQFSGLSYTNSLWDPVEKNYFTSWDTMAHEVLGHGHDYVSGIKYSEFSGQTMQNEARGLLGFPRIDIFQ